MLEILTPPAAALVSLTDAKAHLGVTGTDDDAVITGLIAMTSATVTSYVGRPLLTGTYRETFRLLHPAGKILLSAWPVQSVTAITAAGEALASTDYECSDDGLLLRVNAKGRYECWSPEVTVVTYDAGFDTAPADVQSAVLTLIASDWSARGRDPGMKSIGIGSISLSYFDGANRDPLVAVRPLLDPYRVPVIG